MTEPGGGFLRANVPAEDRWYSRDVAAIAAARGISGAAPYFVDDEATPGPGAWPRGGLTRLVFPNNHLVYALTWFGMALGLGAGLVALLREARGRRRRTWSTQ
jgi:surfeit locus 1 family protein